MPEFTEDQEVLAVYTAETSELLLSLALILRELNLDPKRAAQYEDRLDQIIHTIKGSSAVVGAVSVSALMDEVEKYLRGVRQGKQQLDSAALQLLLDLTLTLSTYLEETFPAPFAGEEWVARFKTLTTATGALPSPAEKGKTPSAGEVNGGGPPESWVPEPRVRPGLLRPLLATLGELTAILEKMHTLYRQGTNALGDWEQLGFYLSTATELNSALRREALRLPLVPVDWLISRVAAESGLPGAVADSQESAAELSGETAAKLVSPMVALIEGLGWTKASRSEGVETLKPIRFAAEQGEELLTLTVRSGDPPVTGAGGADLLAREDLGSIAEAIGQVQGRLEVAPTGDWFQLTVPVFPATVRCLLFQAGAEEYALPARNYLYHLTIKREEIQRSGELTFIFRYPEVIPLVVAADFSASLAREEPDLTLVLLEVERMRFALPVTRVEGYDELLRTDPDRPVVKGNLSFGKAYRRDGRPVLLVDAGELAGLISKF